MTSTGFPKEGASSWMPPEPQGYTRAATGDYNGDGKLDIIWVRNSDRHVLMWQGDGIGFSALPVATHSDGWLITQP